MTRKNWTSVLRSRRTQSFLFPSFSSDSFFLVKERDMETLVVCCYPLFLSPSKRNQVNRDEGVEQEEQEEQCKKPCPRVKEVLSIQKRSSDRRDTNATEISNLLVTSKSIGKTCLRERDFSFLFSKWLRTRKEMIPIPSLSFSSFFLFSLYILLTVRHSFSKRDFVWLWDCSVIGYRISLENHFLSLSLLLLFDPFFLSCDVMIILHGREKCHLFLSQALLVFVSCLFDSNVRLRVHHHLSFPCLVLFQTFFCYSCESKACFWGGSRDLIFSRNLLQLNLQDFNDDARHCRYTLFSVSSFNPCCLFHRFSFSSGFTSEEDFVLDLWGASQSRIERRKVISRRRRELKWSFTFLWDDRGIR